MTHGHPGIPGFIAVPEVNGTEDEEEEGKEAFSRTLTFRVRVEKIKQSHPQRQSHHIIKPRIL